MQSTLRQGEIPGGVWACVELACGGFGPHSLVSYWLRLVVYVWGDSSLVRVGGNT